MYLNVESDGKIPSYDNMFKSFKINGIEYVGTSINGYYNNLPVGECTAKIEWKDDYTGPFVNSFSNNQSLISLNKNFFKGIKPVGPLYWVFSYCRNLISLDLTELDVSNVNNMEGMFNYCTDLTSLDLSNWDTSKVTTMGYMFNNCEKLTSLASIKYWDTSNVSVMNSMFYSCYSLTSLDLSKWDTSNVSEMSFMFSNCQSLTEIRMGGDVSRIDIIYGMFDNIASGGTFYYNSAYDYSRIIELLPSTWTAVSCELINGELIPNGGGGNISIFPMYLETTKVGKYEVVREADDLSRALCDYFLEHSSLNSNNFFELFLNDTEELYIDGVRVSLLMAQTTGNNFNGINWYPNAGYGGMSYQTNIYIKKGESNYGKIWFEIDD